MIVTRLAGSDGTPLGRRCLTWCPGCDLLHPFSIVGEDGSHGENVWTWDGNLEQPTFEPSLLCYKTRHLCQDMPHYELCGFQNSGGEGEDCGELNHMMVDDGTGERRIFSHVLPCPKGDAGYGNCHSFLRKGVWEFLDDSTAHRLRGMVPMVPLPNWLVRPGPSN